MIASMRTRMWLRQCVVCPARCTMSATTASCGHYTSPWQRRSCPRSSGPSTRRTSSTCSRCRRVRLSRLRVDPVLPAGLADRLAIVPAVLVDPADPVRRPVLMNHPSADPATRAPQLPGTPTAVQLVPAVLKCPAVPVAPARIIYMRIARCQKPVPCGPTCLSRPLDSDAEYHIVFAVLLIITTKSL